MTTHAPSEGRRPGHAVILVHASAFRPTRDHDHHPDEYDDFHHGHHHDTAGGPSGNTSSDRSPTDVDEPDAQIVVGQADRTGTFSLAAHLSYDVALGNKARPGEGADVNLDCCALYGLGRADVTPADQAATGSDCITIPARQGVPIQQLPSAPRSARSPTTGTSPPWT